MCEGREVGRGANDTEKRGVWYGFLVVLNARGGGERLILVV
jgi:hypothetical protein